MILHAEDYTRFIAVALNLSGLAVLLWMGKVYPRLRGYLLMAILYCVFHSSFYVAYYLFGYPAGVPLSVWYYEHGLEILPSVINIFEAIAVLWYASLYLILLNKRTKAGTNGI